MKHPLLRFLAGHLAIGVAVGWGIFGGLVLLDVGGLGTLIARSAAPATVTAAALALFAITFGSLAMGAGVMSLRPEGPTGGRKARSFGVQVAGAAKLQAPSSGQITAPSLGTFASGMATANIADSGIVAAPGGQGIVITAGNRAVDGDISGRGSAYAGSGGLRISW